MPTLWQFVAPWRVEATAPHFLRWFCCPIGQSGTVAKDLKDSCDAAKRPFPCSPGRRIRIQHVGVCHDSPSELWPRELGRNAPRQPEPSTSIPASRCPQAAMTSQTGDGRQQIRRQESISVHLRELKASVELPSFGDVRFEGSLYGGSTA